MERKLSLFVDLNRPVNFIGFLLVTGLGVYYFGWLFLLAAFAYNFRFEFKKTEVKTEKEKVSEVLSEIEKQAREFREQYRAGQVGEIVAIRNVRNLFHNTLDPRVYLKEAKDFVEGKDFPVAK